MLNFNWWVNRKDPAGRTFAGDSGSGQHWRVRPQRAASTGDRWSRRTAQPGWRSTARTCWSRPHPHRVRPAVRGGRLQVRRAFAVDRLRDGPRPATPRRWDERDGFFTICCAPDGQACVCTSGRWWGYCRSARPRCSSNVVERFPKLRDDRPVSQAHPEVVAMSPRPTRGSSATTGAAPADPQQAKLERARLHARRERVSGPTAFARCRGITRIIRSCFVSGASNGSVPARRVGYRDVRATPTGGARLDARQCAADPRAREPLEASTATISGSVSTGSGRYMTLFEVAKSSPAGWPGRSCATPADGAGVRRHRQVQDDRTGAI